MDWKVFVIILIVALVCFGAGYSVGIFQTANFIIDKTVNYLDYKNITLNLSKAELISYFSRYFNAVKGGVG